MAGGGANGINAALVAQAAQGPDAGKSDSTARSPAASGATPFSVGTYNPASNSFQQAPAPQAAVPGPQSVYNPFGPSQQGNMQSLSLPGFQGTPNPFVSSTPAPSRQPSTRAADLVAQTQQYNQASIARAAAAKQAQIEQANRIQQAYLAKQQAEKAKAEAAQMTELLNRGYVWQNGKLVKPEAEFGSAAWFAQQNGWTGADGGIADLTQGFK